MERACRPRHYTGTPDDIAVGSSNSSDSNDWLQTAHQAGEKTKQMGKTGLSGCSCINACEKSEKTGWETVTPLHLAVVDNNNQLLTTQRFSLSA